MPVCRKQPWLLVHCLDCSDLTPVALVYCCRYQCSDRAYKTLGSLGSLWCCPHRPSDKSLSSPPGNQRTFVETFYSSSEIHLSVLIEFWANSKEERKEDALNYQTVHLTFIFSKLFLWNWHKKWPQQEVSTALVISTWKWPRCTCALGLTAFGETAGVPGFLLLNAK